MSDNNYLLPPGWRVISTGNYLIPVVLSKLEINQCISGMECAISEFDTGIDAQWVEDDMALIKRLRKIIGECPACTGLAALSPGGQIVCKLCGRDDEKEKEKDSE